MIIKEQKGFTLMELLIVMALIAILLIMVMVNFRAGNRTTELRQAGNNLMQNFRQAQSHSISGNSVRYCKEGSIQNEYYPCADDIFCDGVDLDHCILSVPGGGFGITIPSTDNYSLFADTYYVDDTIPTNPIGHNYFDDSTKDYVILNYDYTLDGIHIKQFKLGDNPAVSPNSTVNRLDILFGVPEGRMKFYLNLEEALDASSQPINKLQLLISSDYVSGSCRKISINRISGQISESQSGCSL